MIRIIKNHSRSKSQIENDSVFSSQRIPELQKGKASQNLQQQ